MSIVAHPVIADLCLAFTGSRLELLVFGDTAADGSALSNSSSCSVAVRASKDTGQAHATCAEWYPHEHAAAPSPAHGSLDAYLLSAASQHSAGAGDPLLSFASGSSSGSLAVCTWSGVASDATSMSSETLYDPAASNNKKQCTSLSWNKQLRHLLAAGFEKSRVQSSDFCFAVWDATQGAANPVYRDQQAQQEPVASCVWLPYDPHVIAAGTSISALRLHDLRMKPGEVSLSIMAHPATRPRKVRGIRPDPFDPHTIATFSDSPGEPVKIWDLRRATTKPKLTISPGAADLAELTRLSAPGAVTVADVAWSQARANMIAVASPQLKHLCFYKTHRPADATLRNPYSILPLKDAARSLSWRPSTSLRQSSGDDLAQETAAFSPNHGLLVACSGSYYSLRVVDETALAVGSAGFTAVNCGNRTLVSTQSTLNDIQRPREGWRCGLRASELSDASLFADPEHLLRFRLSQGYSLSPASNLQVLSEEQELRRSGEGPGAAGAAQTVVDVYRAWQWLERVEARDDASLQSCGVLDILLSGSSYPSSAQPRPTLRTTVYASSSRSRAREVCGWAAEVLTEGDLAAVSGPEPFPRGDGPAAELMGVLEALECEDGFERAAALALWHGSADLAVDILRRNTEQGLPAAEESFEGVSSEGSERGSFADALLARPQHSQEHLRLTSLVAMCIAGCSGSGRSWGGMCTMVVEQLKASGGGSGTAYLLAACRFLLANFNSSAGSAGSRYSDILCDGSLALEDRAAFACTYVDDSELQGLLQGMLRESCSDGRLEGLVLTGIAGAGLDILQTYVDVFSDIQTVALLVGRNIEERHPPPGGKGRREWTWLQEYRSLLNRWQLYIERAALDVELGRHYRHHHPPDLSVGTSKGRDSAKSPAAKTLYELPPHNAIPHVTLKCHYCSSALPADSLQHPQQAANLRKAKAVLTSCPNCRKPLPKCYVCQLYIGLVNPHLELNRMLNQRRGNKEAPEPFFYDTRKSSEHAHNALSFGRWLHFCMNCRHGGHALCIDGWFSGHDVCGVNGCSCVCTSR